MKTSLFSIIAAAALLTSSASFAAAGPFDSHRYEQGPNDRYNDRNSKDFNYGYDRSHRVTAQEKARWEAAQRSHDRYNDRNSKGFNYGYASNHRVTAKEQARWEAAHRNNGRH